MKKLLRIMFGIAIAASAAVGIAQIQYVNTGTGPNTGTGDPARTAFTKINSNFNYLTNRPMLLAAGVATLAAGTATVTTTAADASRVILLTCYSPFGTNTPILNYGTVVTGTSFRIKSSNSFDTNKVSWVIIQP